MNAELEKNAVRTQSTLIVALIQSFMLAEIGAIYGAETSREKRIAEANLRCEQLEQAIYDFKILPLT